MQIHWQSKSLPANGQTLGHGVCVFAAVPTSGQQELVAFVQDFGWLHRGEDAIVRFDPKRLPAGSVRESVRTAVEELVRARSKRKLYQDQLSHPISFHVNG